MQEVQEVVQEEGEVVISQMCLITVLVCSSKLSTPRYCKHLLYMPHPLHPGEENLIDVVEEVIDMASKWMLLGLALRLSPQELDTIKETNHNQPIECLAYMLRAWLQQRYDTGTFGEPSWRLLCQVIHKCAGGNPRLAKEIAKHNCR